MNASAVADSGIEREIDLARWRRALARRWWIAAAGVVVGLVVGGVFSLSGGSVYEASVLLAPSQAFSPNGSPVLSYTSSPRSIDTLASSESTLAEVAKQAHVSEEQLRGHVITSTVATGVASTAARGSVLIQITVQLPKPAEATAAANALGAIVAKESTGPYVVQSIKTLEQDLQSNEAQVASVNTEITAFNRALKSTSLNEIESLLLTQQADNALLRAGNLNDKIEAQTQQLTLTKNIELAQVISKAAAAKTAARSRRNSIAVGLLLGLIFGGIAAVVAGTRKPRSEA
jgi:capsular polysaccharide biosynthesis protein